MLKTKIVTIKHKHYHWEVYVYGVFYCSEDTYEEAMHTKQELEEDL